MANRVHIVGGGLAGSEAAWQAANLGVEVTLHEMRPVRATPAHHTDALAELVCSNSFRSDDADTNAVGLLHAEMRLADSLIMACADAHQVPAGGALGVDRVPFSAAVTERIRDHPNIEIVREEIAGLPPADWRQAIVATGPLTSPSLADAIAAATGMEALSFFDAIAPIVHFDSIDLSKAWFQSRYDKAGQQMGMGGTGKDYLNCPMDRAEYETFVTALLSAEKTSFKQWEAVPYFDGCLPIEIMAERGPETLRHGPMKPMGLTNAHNPDEKPYAVVQLRQDNALGTLFNLVGFQTKLKHGEQVRIFRTIPGLENAEFARLGGLHRNTYLDSPRLLDASLQLRARPGLRFAGQITGCEGYVESAAIGLLAGRFAAAEIVGAQPSLPPVTTAMGALLHHITAGHVSYDDDGASNAGRSFQPMNINYGLFPQVSIENSLGGKRPRGKEKALARKKALSARALHDLQNWLGESRQQAAAE